MTSHVVVSLHETNGASTIFLTCRVFVRVTSFPFTLTLTLYFCVTVTSCGFVSLNVSAVVALARTALVCPDGDVAPATFTATAARSTDAATAPTLLAILPPRITPLSRCVHRGVNSQSVR